MTITMTGHTLPDADRRDALRSLARDRGKPCPRCGKTSCLEMEVRRDNTIRRYVGAGVPTKCTGEPPCGCLACLWDEFCGALDYLEGVYERDVHWQDAAPEYGDRDDPEGEWLRDLEMQVNGLLRDLMHGVGVRR